MNGGERTVVVLGTTTVDVFLSGTDRIPCAGADEFTPESYAFLDLPFSFSLGGNGANSAYALASLGSPVLLCSAIGEDRLGSLALEWLASRRIDLSGLARSRTLATSGTVVVTDRSRHRLSLHHAGASVELCPETVPAGAADTAAALLISGYHLLPCFRGGGYRALLESFKAAGARTAVDLGPVVPPVAGASELAPLLPHVDYVIANEYELASCLGGTSVTDRCRTVLEGGAGAVVVKRGAEGSCLVRREGTVEERGFAVRPGFTVGAGDAFDAAFLLAVLRGDKPASCLRFADAAARLVVKRGQGILGCPDLAAVEELLRSRG
jgi:sugar/nucleoside kinase (ribokinase family)